MLHCLKSLYDTVPWNLLNQYSIKRPTHQLAELTARLPEAFIEGGIEWPLATDADGIDIWATIPSEEDGWGLCAEFLSRQRPNAGADGWSNLDRVLRDWVEPECAAHDLIGDLFLEFDLGNDTVEPIVVASLIGPPAGATEARQAIHCFQSSVLGHAASDQSNLKCALDRLPRSAAVRNVALMPRTGRTLTRLSIWMNVLSVDSYVEHLGTQVAVSRVHEVLGCLPPHTMLLGLQIDLGRVDTIGMEIALPPHLHDPDHFRRLLDFLEIEGSCDGGKRELIERWIQGAEIGRLYRNLIVKINVWPDGTLRSKAYLIFSPVFDQ